MSYKVQHLVRREQSEAELSRLKGEIDCWLERRAAADRDHDDEYLGYHETRLATLKTVLEGAAGHLETKLAGMDVGQERDTGELYQECREVDQAIVWLRRVWEYYQSKFDQRDGSEEVRHLLEAADEIIWSCYDQVFSKMKARTGARSGPPPLAFIAPQYSPSAWEADKPAPSNLLPTAQVDGLEDFLRTLPVPVLKLPPWCVDAPWWLVFVAHEVGHHVQRQLDIAESFKKAVTTIAEDHGLQQGLVHHWTLWSEEILADAFSVMMLGGWAIRAVLEVVLGDSESMVRRSRDYPPPVVRLKIMKRLADELQIEGPDPLATLPKSLDEMAKVSAEAAKHMELVDDVVAALRCSFGGAVGELAGLCDVEESMALFVDPLKGVEWWAERLGQQAATPERSLILPRVLVCGTLRAWESITSQEVEAGDATAKAKARRDALQALSANSRTTLRRSGPKGARAGFVTTEMVEGKGEQLAELLFKASKLEGPEQEQ